MRRWLGLQRVVFAGILTSAFCLAQSGPSHPTNSAGTSALQREFFDIIRRGEAGKFLSYVPEQGVNVGPEARHVARSDVEQQFLHHSGIYCKLFDSSCLQTPIKLDASAHACSYREALAHGDKVRTAATETVRSGVRQAILVAEVKDDQCPDTRLIDFIFNFEQDEWKLFSVP